MLCISIKWQLRHRNFLKKGFQYFKNGLQVASELGCKIMQTNSGWGYWNEDREEAWKRSREMISKLADEAGKLGICLAMESLRPQESQLVVTLKDAKRMYDEVNSPNLKIFDRYNSNECARRDNR